MPKEVKEDKINQLNSLTFDINISNSKVDKFLEENFNMKKKKIICTKCKDSEFSDNSELKAHYKTQWHEYNMKQLMNGKESLSLIEYDDFLLLN